MIEHTQKQILITRLDGTCSAGGDLVLETKPFKPGGVMTFDIVSTKTPTANAVVAIEFVKGPLVYGLRTLKMATADYWYKTRGPVCIPSDWSVRLTYSAAGNAKLCEASIYGHLDVCPE